MHGTALTGTQRWTRARRSTRTGALENWLTWHRPAGYRASLRSGSSGSLRARSRRRRSLVHRTRSSLRHDHATHRLLRRWRSCGPGRRGTGGRLRRAGRLHWRRHHRRALNRRWRGGSRWCGRSYARSGRRCGTDWRTRRRRRSWRRSRNCGRGSRRNFRRRRRRRGPRGRHSRRRCRFAHDRRMRRGYGRPRRRSGRGRRGLAVDRLQHVTRLGNVRKVYLGPNAVIRTRSAAALRGR
jgi:hypothetical protein